MAEIIQEDQTGVISSNSKTLGDTLRELFNPYDMIGVKNITSLPLIIPYLPSKNEKVVQTNITKKVTGREELTEDGSLMPGKREVLNIKPGEVASIPGEMGYIVIPYIINIQLQLDDKENPIKKGEIDTGANRQVIRDRDSRVKELLSKVYLGLPRESKAE